MKKYKMLFIGLCVLLTFTACSQNTAPLEESSSGEALTPNFTSVQELPRAKETADNTLAAAQSEDGTWGYLDKTGEWAILPQFYEAGDFSDGAAAVKADGKSASSVYGYINAQGAYLDYLHPWFTHAGKFSDGIAKVSEKESLFFFINQQAQLAFEQTLIDRGEGFYTEHINTFSYATDFKNGYALVAQQNPENGQHEFFILSKDGTVTCKIPSQYSQAENYTVYGCIPDENGLFIVGEKQEDDTYLYGVLDVEGKRKIPVQYQDILPFSCDLFAAKYGGKYGYLDKDGRSVISFLYEDVTGFSQEAAFAKQNGKWGIIDKNGDWIIEPTYEEVDRSGFCEGLAAVKQGGKWGYIDISGTQITPFVFSQAQPFSNKAAVFADENGLFGAINRSGEVIIEPQFSKLYSFYAA